MDYSEPKQAYLIDRSARVFSQIIQVFCFNQSRQREKIEFELESIGSYMREIDSVFGQRSTIAEGMSFSFYLGFKNNAFWLTEKK